MTLFLTLLALVIALPAMATVVHITTICVASIFYRAPRRTSDGDRLRYVVLVPARNEEAVLAETLAALGKALRKDDRVLVIADRCTDRTAAIAREAGCRVLERDDTAIPGKAAGLHDGIQHVASWDWDALTVLDADSIVNETFFDELDLALRGDASLAQPRSVHIRRKGVLGRVSEAAFALQGVTLPRGRQALGIGVGLRGTGMTLRRHIIEQHPLPHGGASEDLFYRLELLLEGHTATHVDGAHLESHSAPSLRAGGMQRIRWEQGRLAAARSYALRLLGAGTPAAYESAVLLMTPPIAVALFLIMASAIVAWIAGSSVLLGILVACAALLAIDVAIGLIQTRAPLATWLALLVAPFYAIWKAGIQIVAISRARRATEAWEPTARE